MHKTAKEIMDRVKTKINSCGIDGITEQELVEMKYWTCVADAMTSYDYHYKIIEEMEKPENEYGENYDENGRIIHPDKRYYGGSHRRRYYDTTPIDRMNNDRPDHYSDNYNNMGGGMNNGRMHYTEQTPSEYDKARRMYTEAKSSGGDGIKGVESIMNAFTGDIKEIMPMMDAHEKTMLRQKMTNLMNTIN